MSFQGDIGVVGLAVMGENLAMNFLNHHYATAVFNRTWEKTGRFANGRAAGKPVAGAKTLPEFCRLLRSPRKILLMVKAGPAVDELIDQLVPELSPGDILIDGGNSRYADTERRCKTLAEKQIRYVGCGISGGEEGALNGPSLMPGGDRSAWPFLREMLRNIAAKAPDGTPCCDWVGDGGAGHYVKMVHNGIEYADMQMIAEAYDLLRKAAGFRPPELQRIFQSWKTTELNSFLIDITAEIFGKIDPETGDFLLDRILDAAGQKGTGSWTAESALELHCSVPTVAEAVFARGLSADRDARSEGAEKLSGPSLQSAAEESFAEEVRQALYASKIGSYAQGFALLRAASENFGWNLDFGGIAELWRGGCIIRAGFLDAITAAFHRDPGLKNLLFDDFFRAELKRTQTAWRNTLAAGIRNGIPLPAFGSALFYYDAIRSTSLPANLIQAQRDFFGAHTYERTDRSRGEFFHTQWF